MNALNGSLQRKSTTPFDVQNKANGITMETGRWIIRLGRHETDMKA